MADPVKGTIGEDEVVLNNAATETTLAELVKAVDRLSKISSGDASKRREALEELANKSKEAGDQVEDMGKKAEDAGNRLTRGLGHLGNALGGLTEEFLTGSMRISDFSSHITGLIKELPLGFGLAAAPLQLLVSVIDNNIDNFRTLTDVGTDFGGSLFNAQLQATKAGLSLETYTDTITNNAESLALMTGSSTAGARAFTQISGILQRDFGPTASALGMQMHETAQFTADYLEIQTRLGRAQRMDNFQLSQGAQTYIMQLDKLSKLTGKRRDQVAAELKEFADDRRLKALLAGMDPAVKAQIDGTLALLKGASPDLQNIVTELIGTAGIPITDQAKALAVVNPKLRDMAAGLVNGTVSQDEYAAEVRKTAKRIGESSDAQRLFRSRLIALGVPVAEVEAMLIGLDNVGKNLTQVQQEQVDAANRGNQGLLDFERRLTQARNVILGTLIKSGIFQQFEYMLSDIVDFFTSGAGLKQLETGVQVVADFFKELIQDIKDFGLVDTLKMYISDAFSGLGEMIKNFIFGGEKVDNRQAIGQTETKISRYEDQLKELQSQQNRPGISADEYAVVQQQIDDTIAKMNQLRDKRDELAKADREGTSTGILGSLFDSLNMENIRELVSLLGETGGIILGFTAFATILGMFAAGPAAIGGAAIGAVLGLSGAGLYAIGEGIDHIGAGMERVAHALEVVANIQGADNLDKIVTGLGGLGPALATFTAGNALDTFLQYLGASNPFETLIEGVNTFGDANTQAVSNIRDVGTGLAALTNVTDSLDTTPITKYTEAMKELVEVLDKLNDELAEDNKGAFGGGTGVNAAQVIEKMSGGSGSKEELEKLNTTMMMVLQTLQTMNTTGRRQLRATEGMGSTVQ